MDEEKSKLERRKLQYEIWNFDTALDLHTLNHIGRVIHSNYDMIDKNLLYISSGALALSIPLVNQLPTMNISIFGKITLILAWCLFGFTIMTTLLGFHISNSELIKLQRERLEMIVKSRRFHLSSDILDDDILFDSLDDLLEKLRKDKEENKANILDNPVGLINQLSILNFIAAIFFLSIFLIKMLLEV